MFGKNFRWNEKKKSNLLILLFSTCCTLQKEDRSEKKGKDMQNISLITIKKFSEAPMRKVI